MKIKATECKGRDLAAGDLFSTANQNYWDTIDHHHSIGERVFIRTNEPSANAGDADATIYKITILRED